MKVKVTHWDAVAYWKWDTKAPKAPVNMGSRTPNPHEEEAKAEEKPVDESEEEDLCGICRVPFEGCCPGCKVPGDDCPIIWGQCRHVFHMHCIFKWLQTTNSKGQCPMDRRPWLDSGAPTNEDE